MVSSKDGGTSKVYTSNPAVSLMVIPNPEETVTVTELLLLRSNTADDVVTLSPTEDKKTSEPLNLYNSNPTCRL